MYSGSLATCTSWNTSCVWHYAAATKNCTSDPLIAQSREKSKCTQTGECRVKVEVLYVADCPTHPAAVKLVKHVLAAEGVEAEIHEVLVRDEGMASELGFCGSPTIRINGRDVTGESQDARSFALSCRLYPGSKQIGLPPAEMVHQAVLKARQGARR
ncbi:MAG: hypothetical protein DMG54_01995 [Acidobacteria bacterium]|nr:MAG: hypothetical protein DMG54_01995 [Acidobacteriota bacterium]PYU73959.1 MAG: hypothetical protein DMG52_13320 [Acidobacteriota bacterium]